MFISEQEKNNIFGRINTLERKAELDRCSLANTMIEMQSLKSRIINGELKDPEVHMFDMIRAIAEHIGVEFTTIQVPDPTRLPEPPATISKLVAVKKSKPKGKK